ncbi:MAG TPA: hypothetical protein VGD50_00740 [Candidatus Baltobacteraceae bacterium]
MPVHGDVHLADGHTHVSAVAHGQPVKIPVSAGIPGGVRVALISCVALAIAMLGLVVLASPVNHVWPSGNSLKVPL